MRRILEHFAIVVCALTIAIHYLLGCSSEVIDGAATSSSSSAASSASSAPAASSASSSASGAGGAACTPALVGDHDVQAQCDPQKASDCDACGNDAGAAGVCCFGRCVACCPLPGDAGSCE